MCRRAPQDFQEIIFLSFSQELSFLPVQKCSRSSYQTKPCNLSNNYALSHQLHQLTQSIIRQVKLLQTNIRSQVKSECSHSHQSSQSQWLKICWSRPSLWEVRPPSTFALIKTIIMFHYRSPMFRAEVSGKMMKAHNSEVFIEDIEEVRHHIRVRESQGSHLSPRLF